MLPKASPAAAGILCRCQGMTAPLEESLQLGFVEFAAEPSLLVLDLRADVLRQLREDVFLAGPGGSY